MTPNQEDSTWLSYSEQAEKSANEYPSLMHASSLLVILAIYRAFSILDRDQTRELNVANLDPKQFNVLAVLHRVEEPITMRELSKMVAIKPTNLTGLVESLFEKGYISRQTNPEDRRSVPVTTSNEGEKFLNEFLPEHWKHLEGLMSGLSESERTRLVKLLRKLVVSIEDNSK